MIPDCPVCNNPASLVRGDKIYPHRKDLYALNFYVCPEHPDYYVGCHKGTAQALGVLANAAHRRLKMRCHEIFDPLWKSGRHSRNELYHRLAREMRLAVKDTHFGMFSIEQLKEAYQLISKWK